MAFDIVRWHRGRYSIPLQARVVKESSEIQVARIMQVQLHDIVRLVHGEVKEANTTVARRRKDAEPSWDVNRDASMQAACVYAWYDGIERSVDHHSCTRHA